MYGSTQTPVCEGCHRPIRDRYLFRVQDGLWHERCASCSACRQPLQNTCFLRGNKLYCRRDYEKLFLVQCGACSEVISPVELVMRVGVGSVFHLRCFCCAVCACRLQTGDRCVLVGERLLCARDYQHYRPTSSHSGRSEDEDDDEGCTQGAGDTDSGGDVGEVRRPKRPRTILSTQQRRAFRASFDVSSKPCRKVRETLAAETGLSVRVVQVWFQNQRAKMKKLARRQQEQQCQSPQEQGGHRPPQPAPPCGDLPAELVSVGPYVSTGQQHQEGATLEAHSFKLDPFRQGLTPPQMPGDHMNPYGCEALYGTMDSDPSCHHGDCLSSEDTPLLTPIDCLFSMQSSYFAS
ncbi:LIM homeobox transcription factor 1-alpha [Brachyhypopomus gauderio]|uniref:LIM homeobox transcription factor 1-alpha n=1 Tax=Brachyhypopomus gauderio TaxID=698409 RepID=UPI004042D49F